MNWMVLAWSAARAEDDPFVFLREGDGCRVSMRSETHAEGAAMRAECAWPEVDAARLIGLLSEFERYGELVYPIAEVRRLREHEGRTLVYQRQEMFGIADREVLLWMGVATRPEGDATRFFWSAATEEPLELAPGAVRTPKNEGFWEVAPRDGGGCTVVHEIALDAGGSVPRWIVSLVRARGFARIMADVRRIAAA